MSTLTDFAKFWRLAPSERALFLWAVVWVVVIGMGLRFISFRRIQDMLEPVRGVTWPEPSPLDAGVQAQKIASLVAAAARHGPYRANCLPTSLALRHMLLCRAIKADLRVGVRMTADGKLEAHAWVEHEGQPLIDKPDVHQRFVPFAQPIHPDQSKSI